MSMSNTPEFKNFVKGLSPDMQNLIAEMATYDEVVILRKSNNYCGVLSMPPEIADKLQSALNDFINNKDNALKVAVINSPKSMVIKRIQNDPEQVW